MTFRNALFGLIVGQALTVGSAAVSAPFGVVEFETGASVYFRAALAQGERYLYFNEREVSQGEIVCLDSCLELWTPLTVDAGQAGHGDWAVISRPDATLQWAYKGHPLYTYVRDSAPGVRTGDGAGRGVWNVLREVKSVPAGMKMEATLLGYVLTDRAGRTLYVRDGAAPDDRSAASTERGLWQPFEAPWLALDQGGWTIDTLAEGTRQWAYEAQRLYRFAKDIDPGDVYGHRLDGEWSAVILESAPGLPSWMTLQWTDLGLAYADQNGLTLYAPIDMEVIRAAQSCPEDCIRENWRPMLAQPDEKSVGLWVILENDDGQRQWSYKGRLAYTHTRDEKPGDMRGNGIAVGYRIGDGWRIIPVDSGLRRDRD